MPIALHYITNEPLEAASARRAGVDRIMVDLEIMGKEQRQRGRSTVISRHSLRDVSAVRQRVPHGALLVRTNPPHPGLDREVNEVIARGADVVMLPMFTQPQEVALFVKAVARRARVCLLLETPQALTRLPLILSVPGIDEIMVGLNDLHLGLGLRFMFECLAGGLVEHVAHQVRSAGISFGFGGIARVGEGLVPAELILSEHVRLGSSLVILSRSFRAGADIDLATEVGRVRAEEERLRGLSMVELQRNRMELCSRVWRIAGCLQ